MRLLDRAAFEPIGAGQFFGVGETIEGGRAESIVIEQLLPLADHSEIAIVHDDDLDRQSVRGDGSQFRDGHLESAIATDSDDDLVRLSELRADGGRQAESHGADAAGIDPQTSLIETLECGGPTRVLAAAR